MRELYEKSCELLEPYFSRNFHESKERFLIALDKGRASIDIKKIIPAAVQGKVDTLFLEKNSDIFGIYDLSNGGLSMQEELSTANVSLTNLAARKVFEQGGTVYLLDIKDMPDPSSGLNALFRY
jgi:hypothetical protein